MINAINRACRRLLRRRLTIRRQGAPRHLSLTIPPAIPPAANPQEITQPCTNYPASPIASESPASC